MRAATARPTLKHHWRCRQLDDDLELREITDCDVDPPRKVGALRCKCGAWAAVTQKETA